jgi:tetratricopeptide (TPR) repeat protein
MNASFRHPFCVMLLLASPLTLAADAPSPAQRPAQLPAPPPVSTAPATLDREAAEKVYWTNTQARQWDKAQPAAERLVELARADEKNPSRLAETLVWLGNVHLALMSYTPAELAYREALELTERTAGNSSGSLIEPLRGLGYSLAARERHKEAVPLLERAVIISRRTFGLFDLRQADLLKQLGDSLAEVFAVDDAARYMTYFLMIHQRAYGASDARMVGPLDSMADWYSKIGAFSNARAGYRQAIDLAERKIGKNDIALVEPLRGLAASYTRELSFTASGVRRRRENTNRSSFSPADVGEDYSITARSLNEEGEKALERAINLLQASNAKPEYLASTLIQFGDWFETRSMPDKAVGYYKRAIAAVPAPQDAGADDEKSYFRMGFPIQIYYPLPFLATKNRDRPADEVKERYVVVEFTVKSDGSVKDPKVVEQDATKAQIEQTIESMGYARYRPRFAAGEPVDTQNVRYRQVFREKK